MWRSAFLYLSTNGGARPMASGSSLAWRIASRFVAGECLEEALKASLELNRRGAAVELDYLGENVEDRRQAEESRNAYLRLLEGIASTGVDGHVSLKLTQMGLDLDEALCGDSVDEVVSRVDALGSFAWFDMEGSGYTDRTIETYLRVRAAHPNVGIALQAYLYRTKADVHNVLSAGGTIRLVKGAYNEPSTVAYPAKRDVDRNYERLAEVLLSSGSLQAIATHDEKMIQRVIEYASVNRVDHRGFEFQMLYGVRRDLQERLLAEGYRLRVYVPYGGQWYPYFMRRLAERPANLFFLLGNLVREAGRGR